MGSVSENVFHSFRISVNNMRENCFTYQMLVDGERLPYQVNDKNSYVGNSLIITENIDWSIGSGFSLSSITGFQYLVDTIRMDTDFSIRDYFTLTQSQHRSRFTEELRLTYSDSANMLHTFGISLLYDNNSPFRADVQFKRDGINDMILSNIVSNLPSYVEYDILDDVLDIPSIFTECRTDIGLFYYLNWVDFIAKDISLWCMLRANYMRHSLDYSSGAKLTQSYDISYMGNVVNDIIDTDYLLVGGVSESDFIITPKLLLSKRSLIGDFHLGYKYGIKSGGYNVQMMSDISQSNVRSLMISGLKSSIYDELTSAGMPSQVVNNVILSNIPDYRSFDGDIASHI